MDSGLCSWLCWHSILLLSYSQLVFLSTSVALNFVIEQKQMHTCLLQHLIVSLVIVSSVIRLFHSYSDLVR